MTTQQQNLTSEKCGREGYQAVADTVGLVPSLRWKDNLIQGAVVAAMTLLAALVGLLWKGTLGLVLGVLIGLVTSLFLSGFVLMVLGWTRTAKKAG